MKYYCYKSTIGAYNKTDCYIYDIQTKKWNRIDNDILKKINKDNIFDDISKCINKLIILGNLIKIYFHMWATSSQIPKHIVEIRSIPIINLNTIHIETFVRTHMFTIQAVRITISNDIATDYIKTSFHKQLDFIINLKNGKKIVHVDGKKFSILNNINAIKRLEKQNYDILTERVIRKLNNLINNFKNLKEIESSLLENIIKRY